MAAHYVPCFGCSAPLEVENVYNVITDADGVEYAALPCMDAPRVCATCRQDAKVMKAARAEMEKHFEDETHMHARRVYSAVAA